MNNYNQLPNMTKYKRCKKCNQPFPDNLKYCPYCGAKRSRKWLVLLIIASVCVLMFLSEALDNLDNYSNSTYSTDSIATKSEKQISEDEYKKSCITLSYIDLARRPKDYSGTNMSFTGKVIQVTESTIFDVTSLVLRVNVTKDEYGLYDDTIYVKYELPEDADRILENDIITFYGECKGAKTYTAVLGNSVTIPYVEAEYIDIKGHED